MGNEIMCWWHPNRKASHMVDFKDGTEDTPACDRYAKQLERSKATGEFPTTENVEIKPRQNNG